MKQPTARNYDVVVVGARCAGAAIALLLARTGLDVLVIDRTRLPADTVSTHALMLAGVVQLRRWGLLDAVAATEATPVDAIEMTVGDVAFTAPVKHIGGVTHLYAPRRITLDALILDAAAAAGADVRTGHTVHDVLRDDTGRVCGVAGTAYDGEPFAVRARWVVGADGVRSSIARLVDAPVQAYAEATSGGHYAYWSGLVGNRYDFVFAPGLSVGLIPTDAGLTCVFVNCPVSEVAELRRDLDKRFRHLLAAAAPGIADRLAHASRETGYRGVRGLPGYIRHPFGPGWLLVGDAGYQKDPLSAHGITDAFRDAELAARAIRDVAVGGRAEADAMREFHLIRDDFAWPMYEATTRLASYDWDTAGALDLLSQMGDEGEREARFLADLPDLSLVRENGAA